MHRDPSSALSQAGCAFDDSPPTAAESTAVQALSAALHAAPHAHTQATRSDLALLQVCLRCCQWYTAYGMHVPAKRCLVAGLQLLDDAHTASGPTSGPTSDPTNSSAGGQAGQGGQGGKGTAAGIRDVRGVAERSAAARVLAAQERVARERVARQLHGLASACLMQHLAESAAAYPADALLTAACSPARSPAQRVNGSDSSHLLHPGGDSEPMDEGGNTAHTAYTAAAATAADDAAEPGSDSAACILAQQALARDLRFESWAPPLQARTYLEAALLAQSPALALSVLCADLCHLCSAAGTRTDTRTDTSTDTRANTGANTRANTGSNTGTNTGVNTAARTGANTAANIGAGTCTAPLLEAASYSVLAVRASDAACSLHPLRHAFVLACKLRATLLQGTDAVFADALDWLAQVDAPAEPTWGGNGAASHFSHLSHLDEKGILRARDVCAAGDAESARAHEDAAAVDEGRGWAELEGPAGWYGSVTECVTRVRQLFQAVETRVDAHLQAVACLQLLLRECWAAARQDPVQRGTCETLTQVRYSCKLCRHALRTRD